MEVSGQTAAESPQETARAKAGETSGDEESGLQVAAKGVKKKIHSLPEAPFARPAGALSRCRPGRGLEAGRLTSWVSSGRRPRKLSLDL